MLHHHDSGTVAPSRVLVFGAHGFVARTLTRFLGSRNVNCRAIGSREMDLTNESSIPKLRAIIREQDSIVVTSALTPEHGRDRATFMKNVRMMETICTALHEAPCAHVVYISSDRVYDRRCALVDEDSCCEPNDLYGLSHLVREKLLTDACCGSKILVSIVRPSAIYGAEDTHNSYGPNRFVRTALKEGKITLFGQGEEQRDHVYVIDVCEIIRLCLFHRSAGVLNAASGVSLSFADVAQRIIAALPGSVTIEMAPRRVPVIHRQFDLHAMGRAFPEFHITTLEIGLREVIANYIDCDTDARQSGSAIAHSGHLGGRE